MISDLRLEAERRGRPSRLPGLRWWVYAGAFALGACLGWLAAGGR